MKILNKSGSSIEFQRTPLRTVSQKLKFYSLLTIAEVNTLLAQQSEGYDQLYQILPTYLPLYIFTFTFIYLFSFSSSKSCLRDSVEYCDFFRKTVSVTIYYSRILHFPYTLSLIYFAQMRENTDRLIIFFIKMIFLFVAWEDFNIFQCI